MLMTSRKTSKYGDARYAPIPCRGDGNRASYLFQGVGAFKLPRAESGNRSPFRFEGRLIFTGTDFNSYLSSVLVAFLRTKLLASRISFTFETVMSHPGKVQILEAAQNVGYRTYLYYVATDDPAINVSRVKNRVKLNGHDVPPHLVEKRYYRSLDLLIAAIRKQIVHSFLITRPTTWKSNTRVGRSHGWTLLEIKTDRIPAWFKRAVWTRFPDRLTPPRKRELVGATGFEPPPASLREALRAGATSRKASLQVRAAKAGFQLPFPLHGSGFTTTCFIVNQFHGQPTCRRPDLPAFMLFQASS